MGILPLLEVGTDANPDKEYGRENISQKAHYSSVIGVVTEVCTDSAATEIAVTLSSNTL